MVHDTTPRRHLRVVGDTPATADIEMGVTYDATQDGPDPAPEKEAPDAEPLEGRLVADTGDAVTPARASLDTINARLRASLEAGHTYALLAWARWMDATTGYVMDPDLRQDMLDAAEKALDDKRVRAAKQVKRALEPARRAAAEREVERLKHRHVSELEVDARVLKARGARLAKRFTIPAAVVAGPVIAVAMGGPLVCFLAWPAAWCWLALQGRAHARAELGAATMATELETKARHLAAATPAPPAPAGQQPARVVGANAVEHGIIERLDAWEESAKERGLSGVSPARVTRDESGLLVVFALAKSWTVEKLSARTQLDRVRALLAVPTEVRTSITPGETAAEAELRIRTRERDLDTTWWPGAPGIAVDGDSGLPVEVDVTERILVAGSSGSGKSVVLRTLMGRALEDPLTSLVILDLKVEGALWEHTARVASQPDDIEEVVAELVEEMREREDIMRERGWDDWEPTEERPRIVVVVDEGAELLAEVPKAVPGLRSLARRARSAGMPLWWSTQKPTLTGKGAGLDSSISGQMMVRMCLAVSTPSEARNVLGDDASARGWHADQLPMKGWLLVRTPGATAPSPSRSRHMTKEHIKALPRRPAWRHGQASAPGVAPGMPEVLAAALEEVGDRPGMKGPDLAEALGMDLVDMQDELRAAGVKAGRFTPAPGAAQQRGYEREALEDAAARYLR